MTTIKIEDMKTKEDLEKIKKEMLKSVILGKDFYNLNILFGNGILTFNIEDTLSINFHNEDFKKENDMSTEILKIYKSNFCKDIFNGKDVFNGEDITWDLYGYGILRTNYYSVLDDLQDTIKEFLYINFCNKYTNNRGERYV